MQLIGRPHILVVGGNNDWVNSVHCHHYVWAYVRGNWWLGAYELVEFEK